MADKEEIKPEVVPDMIINRPIPGQLSTGGTSAKTSWPELVGLTGEEADKKIKEEMPRVRALIVPSDSMMTMDFRQDRVRIFVDPSGKVTRAPRIG